MKRKKKATIRIILTLIATIAVVVIAAFVWLGQRADHYREMFSEIRPGMSKADVIEIVGDPMSIDTTGSAYEIWTFDVPALFAEQPRCFFRQPDSTLVRFTWEPIDLVLEEETQNQNDSVASK